MPTLRESLVRLRPIHHWALVVGGLTLIMVIGVLLDFTSIRRSPGGIFEASSLAAQTRDYHEAQSFLSRDAKEQAAWLSTQEWQALLDELTSK